MKQGMLYGGTFLFAFVIVTGLLIYLNSSYENIFQFNFGPKQAAQLKDSTFAVPNKSVEEEIHKDSSIVKDSVLLSGIGELERDRKFLEFSTDIAFFFNFHYGPDRTAKETKLNESQKLWVYN